MRIGIRCLHRTTLSESDPATITRCLQEMAEGDSGAMHRLLPLVYSDLQRLAQRAFRNQGPEHTLQPTVLVHEAYLRIAGSDAAGFENRGHFLSVAARAMRQLLTDHARTLQTRKREGRRVLLEDVEPGTPAREVDLVVLDEALEELKHMDARQAQLVELRFFAGLEMREAAEILGISERTAYLDWSMARRWLERRLAE
jgi:RNA polymerase sigma factor (TIGR02999 family)